MNSVRSMVDISVTAPAEYDLVSAAELILRKFGPRAISVLTMPRQMPDGRWIQPKLSANDAYVALDEACRKVARVALRKARTSPDLPFEQNIDVIFPDPVAYLARAVKSVIADEGRLVRRDIHTVSLEQPLAMDDGDGALQLGDTVAEDRSYKLPEVHLVERDEKQHFRAALNKALKTIPANYLEAIKRDIARERERQAGVKVTPETDRERQTVCRARAALATILKREAGDDNPYIRLLAQQRSSRVNRKAQPSGNWSGERQEALFRKLMQTGWTERAAVRPDESVDEAVVNEVSIAGGMAPPSPELRQAVRVLDLYTVDQPTPKSAPAQELYKRAITLRQAGKIEEALKTYRACYEAEPSFIEALNEVGVMYSQLGNLRDALKVYLTIIERDPAGDHKYIAATNAADIYLTWFDAGRNKEKNIELAIRYAQKAMQKPTPMRACNLTLAYVKDRYYEDAKQVMDFVLKSSLANCPSDKYLQTLF
jgi:tetratricopeptide (TPR) repeat protein